jgi:hypothetical protein
MRTLFGTVVSRGTASFMLRSAEKLYTIEVGPHTTYKEPSVPSSSFGHVQAGLTVGVRGTATTLGSLRIVASSVYISPTKQAAVIRADSYKGTSGVSLSGVASNVGSDGFTLTSGSGSVRVKVAPSTTYFETGVTNPTFANLTAGAAVGVAGVADKLSTAAAPLIDASTVYIGATPQRTSPTTTTTSASPTTTTVAPGQAPRGTADGELAPGGSVSNVTSTSFEYTLGTKSVKVMIEPYTTFYLNGQVTTVAALSNAGVTVGTSGVADPSSTSSAKVIDAIHVYLKS